jgi:quercetin dioxygenase-like cupin family protein
VLLGRGREVEQREASEGQRRLAGETVADGSADTSAHPMERGDKTVRKYSVGRPPDYESEASKNVAWYLLPREQSVEGNMHIMLERYEPEGGFAEHHHDFQQIFYVATGLFELTIGGKTDLYRQGDLIVMDEGEVHSGRNASDGVSELLAIDYWTADGAS